LTPDNLLAICREALLGKTPAHLVMLELEPELLALEGAEQLELKLTEGLRALALVEMALEELGLAGKAQIWRRL
jgi:hypothetical protein